MAHADSIYKDSFLEYASYVIKDRAIPELTDGFKPVQRRIIHTLLEMDDGRFHKVANVVGAAMKYHPHGDSSIYEALVNLANCELFIEKQGNYGSFLTGDRAAAARYIECRLLPFAKKVLYNPELTEYVESYDGRNKEPVVFQAKIPIVAIQGTQGIAVGMSTYILPHNLLEVLDCQIKALKGEKFTIAPDFPGGGFVDVENYDDGRGFVIVRAKLDVSDPKKIIITELPFGVNSEQMIDSIEDANKRGKFNISSITDYTAEEVNIEINLQRNTYSTDIVDALYAHTKCEIKISVNSLVIHNNVPVIIPISEMIKWHAKHLIEVLTKELELEIGHLKDRLHARTLERIFVEERIYKRIETKKTSEDVNKAVKTGFKPFEAQLYREVIDEDVERLLKIPIRRISLFDIEKNRNEITEIEADITKAEYNLAHIVDYSLSYIEDLKKMVDKKLWKRKSVLSNIEVKDVKQVAVRNLDLRYQEDTGYIGTNVKGGETLLKVSPYDKIFYMKKNGEYRVANVTDREFIGSEGIFYINFADKEIISKEIFTAIFREKESKFYFIKRFVIPSFTTDRVYSILPKGNYKIVKLSLYPSAIITAKYKEGCGYRVLEESWRFADFAVHKSPNTTGNRLTTKQLVGISLKHTKDQSTSQEAEPTLFDSEDLKKK